MATIVVGSERCRVVCDFGFSRQLGMYGREVLYKHTYRIVRARSEDGPWDFHKPTPIERPDRQE